MTKTSNFGLNKPDYTDVADIADINENTDIIDANLGQLTKAAKTDDNGNSYADVNNMHIRTDNSIYVEGGIKVLNVDPCADGANVTEADIDDDDKGIIVAEINSEGIGKFSAVRTDGAVKAGSVTTNGAVSAGGSVTASTLEADTVTAKSTLKIGSKPVTDLLDDKLSKADGGTVAGAVRFEGDIKALGTNGIYTKQINGYSSVGISGDTVAIAAKDSEGNAADVTISGNITLGGGAVTAANDLNTHKVIPAETDTYTVGQSDLRYAEGHFKNMYVGEMTLENPLAIGQGGTGAATAAGARTALGLGSAATKAYTASVTETGTSLPTSAAVYSAIQAAAAKKTHITIASYDTKNPLAANADYTCTSTNATEILTTALSAIAAGGKIELLEGTYNMQWNEDLASANQRYCIDVNLANITIEGSGWATAINQCQNDEETMAVFRISASNVTLKNFMITNVSVSSPYPMIIQDAAGTTYDNIFFIDNEVWSTYFNTGTAIETGYGCIKGYNSCLYTRIINCRVFRYSATSIVYMFNYGECTGFSGVIGGNISSGANDISILFASESQQNDTAVYGHTAVTATVYE